MKICLSCAAGGHFDELLMTMNAFKDYDYFFVTVSGKTTKDLPELGKTYYIKKWNKPINSNRIKDIFSLGIYYLSIIPGCIKIIAKERPDIIVGFGGEATLHLSCLGKIINAKVIYIESLSRVYTMSGTGKLVYRITDLFVVQSKYLSKKYKRTTYLGRLI